MVVLRKARVAFIMAVKLPIDMIVYTLAVPVVLFVRLIKPWVLIRFGYIRSDVIGHSVFDPEYYLCEREVVNSRTIDCFYFQSKELPNEQWALMVRRHLIINSFFRYLDTINLMFPGNEAHHKILCNTGSTDREGYFARTES